MSKGLLRDNFDLILLAILEDGPKYGLEIIAEAKSRTGGYFDFKEGSLYPALHRLEKAGFVEAEFAPSTMGGPRRRYYRLTEAGVKGLTERREAWERLTARSGRSGRRNETGVGYRGVSAAGDAGAVGAQAA